MTKERYAQLYALMNDAQRAYMDRVVDVSLGRVRFRNEQPITGWYRKPGDESI